MSILYIRLFGGIQLVRQDDDLVPLQLQPIVQAFLAYLLLNRHRNHCREVLSGLFWGEQEESQARRCLSSTLWRLRQELEPKETPQGTFVITTHSGEIGFNWQNNDCWLDIAAFEEKASNGLNCPLVKMNTTIAQQLEEAIELYTGDLLEGFYPDWVLHHRERLRATYIKCLSRLMRYYREQQVYEQSIVYGLKILEIDPLREEIHRAVMRLYDQNGERSQAIKQYAICTQTLAQELDIPPMPETQILYRQLLAANSLPPLNALSESKLGQPESLQEVLSQLDQALFSLEEIRGQLNQARQIVNHFFKQ